MFIIFPYDVKKVKSVNLRECVNLFCMRVLRALCTLRLNIGFLYKLAHFVRQYKLPAASRACYALARPT